MKEVISKLIKNVAICVPEDGLNEKLKTSVEEKRPLIVKLGFDPTAPDLHLGHAVVLKKLRDFQEMGHQIVVIVGDFTALIGDPTGRNKTRPPLSVEEVDRNAKTYINQLSKILDVNKLSVRYNREWLQKIDLHRTIEILSKLTLAQILQRNDFFERYNKNLPISLHEILYPVMQAHDSLVINADIELGGTDQLFNCLLGRQLQEAYEKRGQIVLCMPILVGTDGVEKMSKSKNNYIGLTENPNDMYGKVLSIPDIVIKNYLELATEIERDEQERILLLIDQAAMNPMEAKQKIAFDIVEQYHGKQAAERAAENFFNQVQNRDFNKKVYEDFTLENVSWNEDGSINLIDLCQSIEGHLTKSAIRRLIIAGGVSVDGEKVTHPYTSIPANKQEILLKIGKRGFYRVLVPPLVKKTK